MLHLLLSRARGRGVTFAVLVAAGLSLAAGGSVAQATPPSAHTRLVKLAKKHPHRKVVAIAQFKPRVSERRARTLVRRHHGRVTNRLPAINGLAIRLPARHARALRRSRQVLNVTLDARVRSTGVDGGSLATTYPRTVGADKLWAAGITGKGVGVAVIDSGLSGSLPDFKDADGSSRVTGNVIASSGATRPGDNVGHGTHVAGIIAGNSFNRAAGDPARGGYVGIAPEANLVAIKVADNHGDSTIVDVIGALQFVVDHKGELNIRVVNLSVSSDTPASYLDDPLDAAVEFAWHPASSWSSPRATAAMCPTRSGTPPTNDPYVISVGATDEAGTPTAATTSQPRSRAAASRRTASPSPRYSPRRPHRGAAGHGQRVPEAVLGVRRRRRVLPHRRHVDGGSGRRGRRGAAAAGPP